MRKGLVAALLAGAFFAAAAAPAVLAQNFPNRPIRIIVAVTPGVGFDSNPNWAAEMRQSMTAEIAKWAMVVKTAGKKAAGT